MGELYQKYIYNFKHRIGKYHAAFHTLTISQQYAG